MYLNPGEKLGEKLECQEKTENDQFLTSKVPGHGIKRFRPRRKARRIA